MAECQSRGLITEVTTALLSTWRARLEGRLSIAQLPELGAVVLTDAGHAVERDVVAHIDGPETLERRDAGWAKLEGGSAIRVLACTARVCRELTETLCAAPEQFLGEQRRVRSASEPEVVGEWFPSWYRSRPDGFRAMVRFGATEP